MVCPYPGDSHSSHLGSEGTDAAVKLSVQYHVEKENPDEERNIFIARRRSYHGTTLGALSMSGFEARRDPFRSILPQNTHFISPCYPYRDIAGRTEAQYVEDLKNELDQKIRSIGSKRVAAFIAEPVVGAVSNDLFACAHVIRLGLLTNHIGTWLCSSR